MARWGAPSSWSSRGAERFDVTSLQLKPVSLANGLVQAAAVDLNWTPMRSSRRHIRCNADCSRPSAGRIRQGDCRYHLRINLSAPPAGDMLRTKQTASARPWRKTIFPAFEIWCRRNEPSFSHAEHRQNSVFGAVRHWTAHGVPHGSQSHPASHWPLLTDWAIPYFDTCRLVPRGTSRLHQNRFRSHQPIRPSQSASVPKATTANAITTGGMGGSGDEVTTSAPGA